MSELKSLATRVEVNRQVVLTMINGMGTAASTALPIPQGNILQNPSADAASAAAPLRRAATDTRMDFATLLEIGQKIGRFGFIEIGANRAKLVCSNPSPCKLDQHLITSLVKRSASKIQGARIIHDPTQPCRQKGGRTCTFRVSW